MLPLALIIALAAPPPAHPLDRITVCYRSRTQPRWTLQVDPLTTALGFVHVQVERTLGPRWSLYAGPSLHLFSGILGDDDLTGLGLEVGVRRYFRRTAPEGWWLLLRGVGAHLQSDARGRDETALGGYASFLGGYTAIFARVFVLSGGLGVQYLHYTVAGQGPTGPLPAAHTTLGVAF